ncbi:hypothetical protein HNP40_003875 [Mycobacteroides chelonae]|nr:hypothetical protein [Mycobacteroides chelonae]
MSTPDTATPSSAPPREPRSSSNILLVKIAAVVGIVAGAFVILGVTFGLGVLAGSQCGHHGFPDGTVGWGRHMVLEHGDEYPEVSPGDSVVIEPGPGSISPQPSERQDRRVQPSAPSSAPIPRP